MKALIVAAGEGTRLKNLTEDKPKALIEIHGLTLIERSLLTLRKVGIKDIVVVVGYLGGMIEELLGDGTKYNIRIEYVRNEQWGGGNGISVFKAKDRLIDESKFLLLMVDHLFEPNLISSLKEESLGPNECRLAVDNKLESIDDIDDATKVVFEDGRITDIGKGLKNFNGVDCGAFLCSSSIFDALQERIPEGKDSISDGMKLLCEKGLMRYSLIDGNGGWYDVDTLSDLKEAKRIIINTPSK